METFAGLGYTAGPVIGSVLYEYGGFQLPFFVLGGLLLLATLFSYFLIEAIEDEKTEDGMGMLSMLRIPDIWLMVFAVVICAISLSFFDPTLAGHLESVCPVPILCFHKKLKTSNTFCSSNCPPS
jgi:MFS transporter, DHA1 family, solute carrier family 18 (vesicular amine transporter), member 1/2